MQTNRLLEVVLGKIWRDAPRMDVFAMGQPQPTDPTKPHEFQNRLAACEGGCRVSKDARTGSPFNYLAFTTTSYSRLCSAGCGKPSMRDAEMFLLRGFEFAHEAVQEWEKRFAPLLAEHLRCKRKDKVGRRWCGDETYSEVKDKWYYLYRAIDREGNLVDSMLSETRDMVAAQSPFVVLSPLSERFPAN